MSTLKPPHSSANPESSERPSTDSFKDSERWRREMEIFRAMVRTTMPMAPDIDEPKTPPKE